MHDKKTKKATSVYTSSLQKAYDTISEEELDKLIAKVESAFPSLIEGKALGSDGFALEVLKYCDLDNIILDYVNKLLVSEKPDQWP